jgi:hypothetical protein
MNKKPSLINYLLPVIMIAIGLRHYAKHGMDAVTIIPIVLGVFALYMVLFNHHLLQRVQSLITKLWFPIGQAITWILLTLTFCLVFAPVGLLLRLFKKDILNKNFKVNRITYWLDRPKSQQNDYTKQF